MYPEAPPERLGTCPFLKLVPQLFHGFFQEDHILKAMFFFFRQGFLGQSWGTITVRKAKPQQKHARIISFKAASRQVVMNKSSRVSKIMTIHKYTVPLVWVKNGVRKNHQKSIGQSSCLPRTAHFYTCLYISAYCIPDLQTNPNLKKVWYLLISHHKPIKWIV